VPPRVTRQREQPAVIERPENALAKLGLPGRCIPRGITGGQLRGALIESLAQLPVATPLPDTRGVVVAVVGVGSRAVALPRQLAAGGGLDPDSVVLATQAELGDGIPTWLQITDGPSAEERRRSWRRRDTVTFVAVSLPSVTSGVMWARDL